jgi:crotonobetainyl-CoA:carnitine CoA-transferase CaiB-like acyl-CoA transferase
MKQRAFEGIRVFDASMGVAGPYSTYLMALAGAEVIKVEPSGGDWGRRIGSQYEGLGSAFLTYNRGKRSIALDLKTKPGIEAARTLAARCDIIVESFRPGTMAKFGLDYASLSKTRPELVYLSVSGYGQTGPYAELAALDPMIQAFSGWLDLNRDAAGNPVVMRHIPVDVLTGLYGFQAIAMALLRRFRFGEGQHIDASLMQSAAAFLAPRLTDAVLSKGPAKNTSSVPMGIFKAGDGMISLAAKDDQEFRLLCEALETPAWLQDERFKTRALRIANKDAMISALESRLGERDAQTWQQRLRVTGLPAARVQTLNEFLEDEHVRTIQVVSSIDQPGFGPSPLIAVPGLPIPDTASFAAPKIGEHTCAILSELGYGKGAISDMLHGGAATAAA